MTEQISPASFASLHNLVYLASPYSKYPGGIFQANYAICMLAARLIEAGVPTYCPIAHCHPISLIGGLDPLSHELWLPAQEPIMRVCDAMLVATMEGWRESYGVAHERDVFLAAKKPLYAIDPETLLIGALHWGEPDGSMKS